MPSIDIVFDGEPHEKLTFVEVEGEDGSIRFGRWVEREDGYWVLRLSLCSDCRNVDYKVDYCGYVCNICKELCTKPLGHKGSQHSPHKSSCPNFRFRSE